MFFNINKNVKIHIYRKLGGLKQKNSLILMYSE